MKHATLVATPRQASKKENKELRRTNRLPAVVYGKGYETTSIAVDEKELIGILRTQGESSLVNLEIQDEAFPVLIKEVQRNTLKRSIEHVDFFKVSMEDEIEYNVPIVLVGEAKGLERDGVLGVLQHQKRELTVKSLPGNMLESIEVDVTEMEIGDTLTVADLKIDDTNTILDELDEVVVTLLLPSIEEEEEEEEEVLVEDLEPELVGADEVEEDEEGEE